MYNLTSLHFHISRLALELVQIPGCSCVAVSQDSNRSSRTRPFGPGLIWATDIKTAVPAYLDLIMLAQFSFPVIDGVQYYRRFFNLASMACVTS